MFLCAHKLEPVPLCIRKLIEGRLELAQHLVSLAFIARRDKDPYRRADDRRRDLLLYLFDVCLVRLDLARLGLLRLLDILGLIPEERLAEVACELAEHGLGRVERRLAFLAFPERLEDLAIVIHMTFGSW